MLNPPENLQAIVKTYRPIEELIPSHWTEGDIIANNIRQHYYLTRTEGHSLSTCGEGRGEAWSPAVPLPRLPHKKLTYVRSSKVPLWLP